MARWTPHLSEFNIKLIHTPGKKNIQADALSRRPDLCPEGTDNENVIVLPEHYHDHPTARHPGELQTFNAVKEHYWWPGQQVFVKNYVQGCGTCQQFKIDRNLTKPAFMPLEGAKSTQPFASYSMDLITDFIRKKGVGPRETQVALGVSRDFKDLKDH